MSTKDEIRKLNTDSSFLSLDAVIETLVSYGIIDVTDDVRHIENMIKKNKVLKVHTAPVSQGKGKDRRFFTYVRDESCKGNRRKIMKTSEDELYEYLYDYYFADLIRKGSSLSDVYPQWRQYKLSTSNRNSTVYRLDLDWKKYYLNEPLSQDLITKPIKQIKRAEIKQWACQLIKKYNLTHKAWGNARTILNQIFQYLIDMEELQNNPLNQMKIDSTLFKKTLKKPAATQIFYQDEIEQIIAECCRLAETKQDEIFYALVLFFLTGMRIGEILGLAFDDFDKETSSVYVHQSFCLDVTLKEDGTWTTRKWHIEDLLKRNAEPRTVYLSDKAFTVLQKIRNILRKKKIIRNTLFDVNTPNAVDQRLYRICDRLGIIRRSPHKCRKTYISTLLNKGMDPDFVREQAGHCDLQTTYNSYVYSTTRPEEKVKQLNDILAI